MTNWRDASFGLRILVICGIAAATVRGGMLLIVGALTPGYSHLVNFNSELTAQEAPYQDAATLSLHVSTIFLFLFAIGLARWMWPSRVALVGSALLAFTAIAFVGIGVFPCDPGCSLQDPSATQQAHLLAGFAGMTLHAVTMVVYSFYGRRSGEDSRIGKVSRILAFPAVVAMAWLFAAYFGLAHLLPRPVLGQKLLELSVDIWLVWCAILMVRTQVDQPE